MGRLQGQKQGARERLPGSPPALLCVGTWWGTEKISGIPSLPPPRDGPRRLEWGSKAGGGGGGSCLGRTHGHSHCDCALVLR